MGGRTTHMVSNSCRSHSNLTIVGSTEHWGPCDEDALDQQDIRSVLRQPQGG